MDKEKVFAQIQKDGLVAVIRAENPAEAEKITDACIAGGVTSIELTFTVPHADKVLETLIGRYENSGILIGAGTVMDTATARLAMLSGADYIVSPYFDDETMKLCNRYRIAMMPGIMTIREAVMALEAGAEILKVFPGDVLGPNFIKSVRGPLPYAKMMPTGGVSADNVGDWIRAGAVAVGAGGSLTSGAKTGDYAKITATAKRFLENIRAARAAL